VTALDADVDGDSAMRSSPSDSGAEETNLFPSTNDPATPTPDLGHIGQAAELSPPTSQDPPMPGDGNVAMDMGGEEAMMNNITGEEERAINGIKGLRTKDDEREAPGGTWKTKRAQEEYQRAMESVVDKDFNLRGSR